MVMLTTVNDAARRLSVHRSTVWELIKNDATFPSLVYIRPRCPRLRVADLDRWIDSKQVSAYDGETLSSDLFTGVARGPRRSRKVA